jgi:hypothetical protein
LGLRDWGLRYYQIGAEMQAQTWAVEHVLLGPQRWHDRREAEVRLAEVRLPQRGSAVRPQTPPPIAISAAFS